MARRKAMSAQELAGAGRAAARATRRTSGAEGRSGNGSGVGRSGDAQDDQSDGVATPSFATPEGSEGLGRTGNARAARLEDSCVPDRDGNGEQSAGNAVRSEGLAEASLPAKASRAPRKQRGAVQRHGQAGGRATPPGHSRVGDGADLFDAAAPAMQSDATRRDGRGRARAARASEAADAAPRTIPLNRHGVPDKRYKTNAHRLKSNEARSRKRPGLPPGEAWRLRLEKTYGPPHRWDLVGVGYDAAGRKAQSGYMVKRYAVLRCLEHPDSEDAVIAGRGEARLYAGVVLPTRREGRPTIERPEFRSRFLDAPADPVRSSGAPQVLRIPRVPADLFTEPKP